MSLKNRVVFLTGAGGGIGRVIATDLAKEKATIVLFGGNNLDKLNATKLEVESLGAKCCVFACDLTDDSALYNAYNSALDRVKGIDVLINNAGMAFNSSIEQTSVETYDKIMKINARVPFVLTKTALPYLKKSNRATIINIASVVGHSGYPDQSAYSASKHALLGFTKSLANEVYKDGIRVHAISPGGVYTDMIKIARPDLDGQDMIQAQDVSQAVMFLLKNRTNAVIDEIVMHRAGKPPFLV